MGGIGGRIEGRPFRKGLWVLIFARPDFRGACGKAAAPALGLGSTGRQTGAGQIRWGSTPDGYGFPVLPARIGFTMFRFNTDFFAKRANSSASASAKSEPISLQSVTKARKVQSSPRRWS